MYVANYCGYYSQHKFYYCRFYYMEKEINFGIGFVTGRSNVCRIINSYYQDILEQVKRYDKKVNITIFILFDTAYQQTQREEIRSI